MIDNEMSATVANLRFPNGSPFLRSDESPGRKSGVRPDLHFRAIAREAGVHESYLSKLFRGYGTPSLPVAQRLSVILGVTIEELYEILQGLRELREANSLKKKRRVNKARSKTERDRSERGNVAA